ncbi:mechanosensitive ion channel family protein [Marinoscillum sp. 108]|uniref:mechanosensitive ion channel family protein n=1 Tax=Marinoscillum sp. 108 TaxID=2653151 RepID=UPI0012F1678A|nr:mechanosensitive ion channel domain-containing protein [Marinoscillum sp. 108]VXD14691.1 Transporter [Marinoscillum sp. 108]
MQYILDFLRSTTGSKLIQVVIVLTIVFFVVKMLQKGLNKYIKNSTTRYQARKVVSFLGYILALLALMLIYNYKFSNLTLALGVAGAGIAFALQEVIVSIAGFLAILFGNFYKIGDRVKLGGIKGDVVDIGILRTTLMEIGDWVNGDLYNGKMVRVANSFIFKEPVFNYSGDFPFLWDEIGIPLKHSSDHQLARQLMLDITTDLVKEFTLETKTQWNKLTDQLYVENAQIDPMVTMAFDENWITFTIRYVVDFKRRRITKDQLYTRILETIDLHKDKFFIASAAFEVTHMNEPVKQ